MIQMVSNEVEDKVAAIDPLEMSLVEDLTELVRKYNIPVGVFPGLFNALWHKRAYYWIWINTEPDIRHRVLVAIQGGVELLKHHLKQEDFWEGKNGETFEALFDRIFDPTAENPSDLSHVLPSGNFVQFMYKVADSFRKSSVEDLRAIGRGYFDLTDSDASKIFDLILDVFFEPRMNNEPDKLHRLLGIVQRAVNMMKLAMVHLTKEDNDQQGESIDAFKHLYQRLFDALSSCIARSVQQKVTKNTDGSPLD